MRFLLVWLVRAAGDELLAAAPEGWRAAGLGCELAVPASALLAGARARACGAPLARAYLLSKHGVALAAR